MTVTIYCECLGCADQGYLKKVLPWEGPLPVLGTDLDGLPVRRVRQDSRTQTTDICISNDEGMATWPDSARPLGRQMRDTYHYTVCTQTDWNQARYG